MKRLEDNLIWAELKGEMAAQDIKARHWYYAMTELLEDRPEATGPEIEAYATGFAIAHHDLGLAAFMLADFGIETADLE